MKPRRKHLEGARRAGLGGFKKTSGTKPTVKEMWDGKEGEEEGDGRPSETSLEPSENHPVGNSEHNDIQSKSAASMNSENWAQKEEDQNEEGEQEKDGADKREMHHQTCQQLTVVDSAQNKQSDPPLTSGEESHKESQAVLDNASLAGQEQKVDPPADPNGELENDCQGESHPCPQCERCFSTKQGLERHIHIHAISNQQAQLFKCRYCTKSFGSQVGRRRHERRHENGFKKKSGSLAGASSLLSPAVQTDSSPDCASPAGQYIAVGSQFTARHMQNPEIHNKEFGSSADRPLTLEENGESKELHPCKYCNKAFGTHTNMRRHQRRIHERHLLPKGVRRKGMLLQEATTRQRPGESPSTSPPPVYVPSADTEDEADRDDYTIDISKNISENLSFYIDGKIVSTSTVSSCEVIEVDARNATLLGLDRVLLSPNQFSQALKVEARTSAVKQMASSGQPAPKRRTSTPPLVTGLKVETETSSSASSSSSSSNLLVGGLFQQTTDSGAFQREKSVYLSPKLKQLLQTQDFQKSSIALITESHRLAPPLSVCGSLQGPSGKFKRRTASPPSSSPQLSPTSKNESCKMEVASAHALKVPKLESHSVPPSEILLDRDMGDNLSLSGDAMHSPSSSSSGGNCCNQQPLDLSNSSVSWQSDSLNKVHGDSALDLSFHRKIPAEVEVKGTSVPQPQAKKRKPNTSMLEKVLMNEYVGLTLPADEGQATLANITSFSSHSPAASDSAHPSPPSLTPVTMNPSSPGTCIITSPTPPPPVLPTIPSPPTMPCSPLSQTTDSPALRPLPVLSPEMSPKSVEHESMFTSAEKEKTGDEDLIPEPLDSTNTVLEAQPNCSATSSSPRPSSLDLPDAGDKASLPEACDIVLNGSLNHDNVAETEKLKCDLAAFPSTTKFSSTSASHLRSHESSPSQISQSLPQIKVKEEPQLYEEKFPVTNNTGQDGVNSSPPPADYDQLPEKASEGEEFDYCKTFVCNVCEKPFNSIKELSGHITEHAADWPFKCEFCVQLFGDAPALLVHRTSLHGVGQIFVCSVCSKEFAFLCNLQQHQKDLHPNETCSHTTVESGKLRPQNYTDPSRAKEESSPSTPAPDMTDRTPQSDSHVANDEPDVNGNHADDPNEELYTTIKIMASEGGKPKGPDVRLGINQHYPSYKPPPFPYHSRSHAGSVASATNFTTHNIPQTFSTAIRCTKCGNSFDNMPELHKHILACANASDKKRYTPKKNPIPLKQIVKSPNGVASPTAATAGQGAFRRMGQPKRLNFNQDTSKTKMSALSKKKNQLVQKAITQKNKAATTAKKDPVKEEEEEHISNVCPHCSRVFTYPASLNKHMSISCPKKPVATKKGKKGLAEVKKESTTVVEKSTGRKKASDSDTQTEPEAKAPVKTRARFSSPADPEYIQPGKGKPVAKVGRMKRPASFPPSAPGRKKTKKAEADLLPAAHSAEDSPSETPQRPAMRMQRMVKDREPKRSAEAKSPPQLKKEERFSLRTRERLSGPVTRSLQMTSTSPPAEVKTEEPPIPEPKETQEVQMK